MADFLAPLSTTVGELTLRTWQPGDGETLARVANASYEHLSPWMEWAVPDDTPEAAEVRLRGFAGDYLKGDNFVLSAWLGDELVGGTGYHPRWGGRDTRIAEIGMWIAGSHAGRGLGTRVLATMVAWGFSESWGWRRLVWTCDPANVASVRVAEKAGFRLEGTLRGTTGHGPDRAATAVYGLLPSDLEG